MCLSLPWIFPRCPIRGNLLFFFIALTLMEIGIHLGIFSWLLSHTRPTGTQTENQEDIYLLGCK